MSRFSASDRSRAVAIWLFITAGLVAAMILVGGATRLTDSGLSITEWKPVTGVIPPLSQADWLEDFRRYQAIPEYQLVNAGMSLEQFKTIYWWEWGHRFLGRLIGLVFAIPFAAFLITRRMPRRLVWRCAGLLALGGLQGAIGWWMVASGLSERVDVAPERLTVHLGMAFIVLALLVWTGLEALKGPDLTRSPQGWTQAAAFLLGLIFVQCLLGALVAGNDAGFVYNTWPSMEGALIAPVDWSRGAMAFLHDKALVQFVHRMGAYAVLLAAVGYALQVSRSRPAEGVGAAAYTVLGVVCLQALLGIITLVSGTPLWLGLLHQAGAIAALTVATINLWVVRRSRQRLFFS
ncbi:COX15/CtaA family protein [Brevundimonas sp. 2R-24]|uniref:Heme A synthase n=1 Tax=Peiella sedimenti TaxID=3061083 RepID=A0ABT8SJC9_9CAUL|nr:COX15/CtaA family protein [Caulobacteraceae bacterium XZ-24]